MVAQYTIFGRQVGSHIVGPTTTTRLSLSQQLFQDEANPAD